MYEENPIVTAAVVRVVDLFRTHKRGQVVTWEQIEATSGITRMSPEWAALNKRFRRDFLKETGIAVWPVNGLGLKLVTHEFQLKEIPKLRQQRACRQYTKSLRAVQALPDRELSLHQQITKSARIGQLKEARRRALELIRIREILSKPRGSGVPQAAKPK